MTRSMLFESFHDSNESDWVLRIGTTEVKRVFVDVDNFPYDGICRTLKFQKLHQKKVLL